MVRSAPKYHQNESSQTAAELECRNFPWTPLSTAPPSEHPSRYQYLNVTHLLTLFPVEKCNKTFPHLHLQHIAQSVPHLKLLQCQ